MTFFSLQIIIVLGLYLCASYYKIGLRYFVMMLLPMSSVGLVWFDAVTAQVVPVHLFGFMLFLWAVFIGKQLRASVLVSALIILLPFILSLIYNYFYFTPMRVFEIEAVNREGWDSTVLKTSLSKTNISQLAYLLFALALYWVYSSLHLNKKTVRKSLDFGIWVVCLAACVQFITYYLDAIYIYEYFFYTISEVTSTTMHKQVFFFGIKRLNATFGEPSYLGYFCISTLIFYAVFFGRKAFTTSKAVKALVLVGLASTSTTFLWGAIFLGILVYLYFTDRSSKVVLYLVVGIFAAVLFTSGIVDFVIDGKSSSTEARWYFSWTQAWVNIYKSPFFGIGYGTDRPLFIYTQLLSAVGFVGLPIVIYGIFCVPGGWAKNTFLLGIVWIGMGVFELSRPELWVYLGLLTNTNIYSGDLNETRLDVAKC